MKKTLCALAVAGFICSYPLDVHGDTITLSDMNSSFSIDPGLSHGGVFQRGAYSWIVDGTEHLFASTSPEGREWFWYRIGAAVGRERSIDTLTFVSHIATDTTPSNPGNDTLVLSYTHEAFDLSIVYKLTGGTPGSQGSLVHEDIIITPKTDLDFHLFEYDDFNMQGTAGGDTAVRTSPNSITQRDTTSMVTVTAAQTPDHWEIATVPTTLNKLNDPFPTTLSDTAPVVGPGNVAFAFQWDVSLIFDETNATGVPFLIQKDKVIAPIPEPTAMVLLGTGLLGMASALRRRRNKPSRL